MKCFAVPQLLVLEQVAGVVHHAGRHAHGLQPPHQIMPVVVDRPPGDHAIQLVLVGFAYPECTKLAGLHISKTVGDHHVPQRRPLRVVEHRYGDPPVGLAAIAPTRSNRERKGMLRAATRRDDGSPPVPAHARLRQSPAAWAPPKCRLVSNCDISRWVPRPVARWRSTAARMAATANLGHTKSVYAP